MATKLRALLQRDKGRDLFDLAQALDRFEGLDTARAVEMLGRYLRQSNLYVNRAEAERRMFAKLKDPRFLIDLRPLLPAPEAARLTEASTGEVFHKVFSRFIVLFPGAAWTKTAEMKKRFGISDW